MTTENTVSVYGKDYELSARKEYVVSEADIRYLAGALAVGGSILFRPSIRRGKTSTSYPYVGFQDTNEKFVDKLVEIYAGTKTSHRKSYLFNLTGYRAAELIVRTEPYVAVSRKRYTIAAKNWLDADGAKRLEIAETMKGYNRYEGGSKEEYETLVADPAFVAGIVDSRGFISILKSQDHGYPLIRIISKNRHLLDALQELYGGTIGISVEVGTKINIGDRSSEVNEESYELKLGNENARKLISKTKPYLKKQPYDGWDYTRIRRVSTKKNEKVT